MGLDLNAQLIEYLRAIGWAITASLGFSVGIAMAVSIFNKLTGEIDDTFVIESKILNGDLIVYEGLRGNQPYRPDNVMERMFQYMKTMMGSEVKKDEIKKSIQTKIDLFNSGLYMKGDPPFGYNVVDRKLVVDKEESKWVIKIFDWYVNCKWSIPQIQKELKVNILLKSILRA